MGKNKGRWVSRIRTDGVNNWLEYELVIGGTVQAVVRESRQKRNIWMWGLVGALHAGMTHSKYAAQRDVRKALRGDRDG